MKKWYPLLLVAGSLCLSGCRQDMAAQPRYNPLQASAEFDDGRSARPLEPGTVPRGQLRLDAEITDEVKEIPLPMTAELLHRGREQFFIRCTPCHDRVGNGNGMVVQRSFLRPPSYHSQRLREMSVGHIYQVISRGQGGMPAFYDQITPRDRWAIISYVRALQLSQNFKPDELSEAEKKEWQKFKSGGGETAKKEPE